MKKLLPHIPFFILLLAFIILKIPYLHLPYFWDEAWVYGPAIHEMAVNGPSLAPDAIPPELGRGHPLLFHFFGSLWINIFGGTLLSTHSFALTVTLLFLISVYTFLYRNLNPVIAFFAPFLLCVQPVFFTQSVLVLPEIMLAFFCLLALFHYISGRYYFCFIFSTMAILTKESAIVLFVTFSFCELLFSKGRRWQSVLLRLLRLNLPLLAWLLFLIWQRSFYGWWLFPEHAGSVSAEIPVAAGKFENYFSYLFIYQGRNMLTIILLLSVLLLILFKLKINQAEKDLIRTGIVFMIFFLLFSSINFFSSRYILSLIALNCIITAILVFRLPVVFYLRVMLIIIPVISGGWNTYKSNLINDHNPGYADAIKCTGDVIQFVLHDPSLRNKKIYTTFLIAGALKDHRQGYVKKEEELRWVSNTDPDAELIILNNFESAVYYNYENPGKQGLIPIYDCTRNKASVKLFRKVPQ